MKESEEKEVERDLDWLVQRISVEREQLSQSFDEGKETADESAFNDGKDRALSSVLRLIDQLDEPEVLSDKWIDEKTFVVQDEGGNDYAVVENRKLKKLLIPKQDVREYDHQEYEKGFKEGYGKGKLHKLNEREQLEAAYKDILISGDFWFWNKWHAVIEKPVIPSFVAEWIEYNKDVATIKNVEDAINEIEYDQILRLVDWYNDNNQDTFARAWLAYPDIEVEEEQKYYVLDKEDATLLKKSAAGEGVAKSVGTNIYNVKSWKDEEKYQLTEQEIKDYDERFWPFRKPVEELEE